MKDYKNFIVPPANIKLTVREKIHIGIQAAAFVFALFSLFLTLVTFAVFAAFYQSPSAPVAAEKGRAACKP